MRLVDFLQCIEEDSIFLTKYVVYCFRGAIFQPVFFRMFFSSLVEKNKLPGQYQYISFPKNLGKELQQFEGLRLSMLGGTLSYWLGDLSSQSLSRQLKKELPSFIVNYTGPHHLFFFSDIALQQSSNMLFIDCEADVSVELILQLISFRGFSFPRKKVMMIVQHAKEYGGLSLDGLCMLINYFNLIAMKTAESDIFYIKALIGQDESLSALVEAFLERNSDRFFYLWTKLKPEYGEPFWIIFWADIFWRAYHVRYYMEMRLYRQAKQMSYRLPFAFINKLWKRISSNELLALYQDMYTCDYRFKVGAAKLPVEAVFFSYFLK